MKSKLLHLYSLGLLSLVLSSVSAQITFHKSTSVTVEKPSILALLNGQEADSAEPFLKKLGRPDTDESALGIYDAKDGNLYITGISGGDSLTIMKMTAEGTLLWTKAINLTSAFLSGNSREVMVDLIVDDEGMIVCTGTIGNNLKGFILRYDPTTSSVLWIQELVLTAHAHGLVQDPEDGHFIVYSNSRSVFSPFGPGIHAKITKINKATGVFILIPASAINYETDEPSLDLIRSMVVHDGKYYGCGGFTFPGLGSSGRRHNISKFGLNGDVEWSFMSPRADSAVQNVTGHDLLIEDGHIISTFSGNDSGPDSTLSAIFLQKSTLEGMTIWVKKIELGPTLPFTIAEEVVSVPDGFVLLCRQGNGLSGLVFIKMDKEGALVWVKKLDAGDTFLDDNGIPQSQLLYYDSGIYFAAANRDSTGHSDVLIGKMSLDGSLGISCPFVVDIPATENSLDNPESVAVNLEKLEGGESVVALYKLFFPTHLPLNTLCNGNDPMDCDTVRLAQIIEFCPGNSVIINGQTYVQSGTVADTIPGIQGCDTIVTYTLILLPYNTRNETIEFCLGSFVTINGQNYSQPGMVIDTIQSGTGCDTLVTYSLQYSTPAPSQVSINCPNNISAVAEPGTAPLLVHYNQPTCQSDCLCPGVTLLQTSGLPSGGLFANGITTVCFAAKDSCGQSASCCFTVTVREKLACDKKVIGCLTYEVLDITADVEHNLTYRIQVTNNCPNELIYSAIQLPEGLVATAPANNALYEAPSTREYEVRNPNFSPFYSIRFKSIADNISNGQEEVFEYTLPAQTAPNYIHITSRLAPQLFYEAHLNTFNCPIGITPPNNKPTVREKIGKDALPSRLLYPNPTNGLLFANLTPWAGAEIRLSVLNHQGQLVWQRQVSAASVPTVIDLPRELPNGLYFFELNTERGSKEALRFILARE